MRVDLRSEHDLGQIVGYGYRIYGAHFRALFLIALVTAPPQMLAVVLQRQIADDMTAQAVGGLIQVAGALVGIIATGAVIFSVHEITGGTAADAGRALDTAIARAGALITTTLLGGLLAILSVLAFPFLLVLWLFGRGHVDGRREWWMACVPFALPIYLGVRWGLSSQAIMIDGQRRWAALDMSAAAVRGYWWRTLGIQLVIGLIAAGPVMVASISTLAAPIVEAVVTSMAGALILPFAAAAQTLLYYDLKARNRIDARPVTLDDSEPDLPG